MTRWLISARTLGRMVNWYNAVIVEHPLLWIAKKREEERKQHPPHHTNTVLMWAMPLPEKELEGALDGYELGEIFP